MIMLKAGGWPLNSLSPLAYGHHTSDSHFEKIGLSRTFDYEME